MIDEAVEEIGAWAAALPAGNAALFIEPLNRSEAFLVNRVEQGADLARRVNNPRVLTLADSYPHEYRGTRYGRADSCCGQLLGHVHVADNNRLQPGKGHIDWKTFFSALNEIDYPGYVSIECWSPAGPRLEGDPKQALPESVAFMRRIWSRRVADIAPCRRRPCAGDASPAQGRRLRNSTSGWRQKEGCQATQ